MFVSICLADLAEKLVNVELVLKNISFFGKIKKSHQLCLQLLHICQTLIFVIFWLYRLQCLSYWNNAADQHKRNSFENLVAPLYFIVFLR